MKPAFSFVTSLGCATLLLTHAFAAQRLPAAPKPAPDRPAANKAAADGALPLLVKAPTAALAKGREALTDRRYTEAITLLKAAALQPASAEEATFLLGNAQFNAKEYGAAIMSYDALIQGYPSSRWLKKSRFKKADALAGLGKWADAAAIYEPELEYIVSVNRREQVATTYLKYAGQYFAPVKKENAEPVAPNFVRAKALYLKALEIGLTPGRTAEVLLRVAQSDYEAKNYVPAIQGFERVLREYPNSEAAADARIGIGLSYLKAGGMRAARRALRDFLTDYPRHERRPEAFLAIAESYRVPVPPSDKELELGVAALRDFVENFPNHKRAIEVEYWIGLSYFNRERHDDAVREFQLFLAAHKNSDASEVSLAQYYLGAALLRQKKFDEAIAAWQVFLREHPVHAMWNQVQRELIDAQYAIGEEAYKANKYDEARRAWDVFTDRYPLDARNADIMFRLGVMLHDAKKYDEAIAEWRKVISKYGSTEAASRAQFMIAQTYEKLDRWEDTFAALRLVQGRYQGEAQARLTLLKDRRMVVYTERAFTTQETPTLRLVTRNVARLQMRAYRVDMRDYFLKTHTVRGVDNLDLNLIAPDKTWVVETKNYAPYKELETVVPVEFQAADKGAGVWAIVCRALDEKKPETEIVLPAAATAAPAELEATSIVAVTDLGVVTKATRNDIFVWAENLVTQQPVPGAQVLVSDGGKIVARGTTDAQGVFHYLRPVAEAGDDTTPRVAVRPPAQVSSKPSKKPGRATPKAGARPAPVAAAPSDAVAFPAEAVRVLAIQGGNFASTEGSLGTVAQVASLTPTGFLYTDRPIYRPGQVVQLRGIVRQVSKGAYAFSPGAAYSLTVDSPGGASIHARTVQLNEWGTFNDSLTLPAEAAPGSYRIRLVREAGKDGVIRQPLSAFGGFSVATYKLDKIRLTIAPEKSVLLRGETVTGKVTAKYYYGEPLRKRKIRFGWKDGVGTEIETDDKGEFPFSIPTRDFEEDEAVRLWARLDEEGASAQSVIYVAAVGVNSSVTLVRDVYLAGEGFEATVKATDLANKPFAGAFTLRVLKLEKTSASALSGEREVTRMPVQTAKDGTAKAALNLRDAGDYILRLEGKDGSGNPVTSEAIVQIAGADDDVRLRVISDTDTLKSGDKAAIRVLWRGPKPETLPSILAAVQRTAGEVSLEPAESLPPARNTGPRLALVTYEGDRIYGHQVVTLARGENTIPLPVEAKFAPIFRVSVSLMDGDDLHLANKWFAVTRELQVKLEVTPAGGGAKSATYRPGDKVRVKVTTTDQNGNPVAAELSLAAVDEALLAAGGNVLPLSAILGARNATSNPVLTVASNTFNFTAEARQRVLEVRQADNFARTMLAGQVNEYPDIPKGHWSYDALNTLASAGVIEGRPGGKYYGSQPMTRYEAAVAIARLLKNLPANAANTNGAEANEIVKALRTEFAPELANLGVRVAALEDRRGVLESRTSQPQRTRIAQGLIYDNDIYANQARQFNMFKISGNPVNVGIARQFDGYNGQRADANTAINIGGAVVPGSRGLAGPQGSPGPPAALASSGGMGAGLGGGGEAYDRPITLTEATQNLNRRPSGVPVLGQLFQVEPQNALLALAAPDADTLRSNFAETAFWNSHVVTDAAGTATVEFTLPDSLTQWRVSGRGVTLDTLVGEGEDKFTSSKPFWVELQAPPILQSGDSSIVGAVLHNAGEKAVQSTVTLRAKFDDGAEKLLTQTLAVEPGASADARFDLDVPDARRATLTLAANGGGNADSEKQSLTVRAWGIDRTASAGGFAQDDRAVTVALPAGEYASGSLSIVVGPPTPAALLDMVENPGGFGWRQPLAAGTVLRLSALVRAADYLKSAGNDKPRFTRMSRDIEGLIARLVVAQSPDGGWTWSLPRTPRQEGDGRESDLTVSAEAVAALTKARALGFVVSDNTMKKAQDFLARSFQGAAAADNETKARILYAQSVAGTADFAFVNGLYRLRNSLNARSLAYLALTLQGMQREVMAREIIDLLAGRTSAEALRAAAAKPVAISADGAAPALALDANEVEDVALAALAITEVEPKNPLLPSLVGLLWARRSGTDWAAARSTGYALVALLENAVAARTLPETYTLAVSVDGKAVRKIVVDADATTDTITVPLAASQAKVSFNLEGRGTYAYSVLLTGFTRQGLLDDAAVAAMQEKDQEPQTVLSTGGLHVNRSYSLPPHLWNGKLVPRGYSTVSTLNDDEEGFDFAAKDVAVGGRVTVNLSWYMDDSRRRQLGSAVVLREPLPAGARVLEESISGDFERYQLGDREILFFFSSGEGGSVSYDLYGAQPGRYRVLPARVWSFNRPGHYAFSTYKDFQVLARGAQATDTARITPDEIYWIGKWSFDRIQAALAKGEEPSAGDIKVAETNLKDLYDRDLDPKGWKLEEGTGKDVANMLFTLALRRDDNAGTVRYFEVLRERFPDLVIAFPEIVRTAKAYGKIGEVEREVQVLRATAEASFRRETGVAGTLVEEGEHQASYQYLAERAVEYPDLANVESAVYTLAQTISQRAEAVAKEGRADEAKNLTALSAATVRDFLVLYPQSPLGDEAGFSYAVNLVEQGKFADAIAWTERCRARYGDSVYTDDYDYIATYASFLAERYDVALKLAGTLATEEYLQPGKQRRRSAYRPFALYIGAQIHHARGELGPAMANYREVSQQFPDARESADFFDQKSLNMPEVTVVGAADKVQFKATARNVGKAQIAVYKVDLLQFYQERRNLVDLGQMNLAGIKPAFETSIDFGAAKFTDVEKTVALALPDKGAYFVTIKAADGSRPFVSGVVVRSGLEVEVQEDTTSGRVRVNVSRRADNKGAADAGPQPKAEVWAIGSGNTEFRKGTTDLRGIVALDDVKGRATVIAFKGGEYAFYRGEAFLQQQTPQQPAQAAAATRQYRAVNGFSPEDRGKDFKAQARDMYMNNANEIVSRNSQALQGAMTGGKGSQGLAAGLAY